MEMSHSLILNEDALAQMPDPKKPVFVYEWLRFLDKILPATQKADIKGCQEKLVQQLTAQILAGPGPPTKLLLGRCLATLFSVGDSFRLLETVNKCNDVLKNKDDSPSQLPTKLAAVCCIGAMYEKLGRLAGPGFEETTQILVKYLKNAESQGRAEIMLTFEKIVLGLGNAGSSVHKDIYKAVRACMTDRVMPVRAAAASCLKTLAQEAQFLSTAELESLVSTCFKALEASNYEVRCAVGQLLGTLLSLAHSPKNNGPRGKPGAANGNQQAQKPLGLEECLNLLAAGFLRGGMGFLKGSSGITTNLPKEIRIGVSMGYVAFVNELGAPWLERHLSVFLRLVLDLASVQAKSGSSSAPGIIEGVFIRRCVNFILRSTAGKMLGEKSQTNACKDLGILIAEQMNSIDYSVEASVDRVLSPDILASQHVLICAFHELSSLVQQIGTSVTPLFTEASGILEPVFSGLLHPCQPTRIAAAWCLRCVTSSVPSQLTPLIDRCLRGLEHMKASPDALSGYSLALGALLGGCFQCPLGIPYGKGRQIFSVAEELLRTASQSSRLATVKTQAGWVLLSSIMTLGPSIVKHHLPRMLLLWKNAFPRSPKEAEAEKQRGDSFTWQVTLEARAGALCAMQSFFAHCKELVTEDVVRRVLGPIDAALTMLGNMPNVARHFGQQLRTPIAVVKLRLYGVLGLIGPKFYESCFSQLLRELVAEVTLTDASGHGGTATSLLASMCHPDDRTLLGSWLQDTDHSSIEEQLHPLHASGCGSMEHDPFYLCTRDSSADWAVPSPLPLAVSVIDSALLVYGRVFPFVAAKHRLQMLDHFGECIKSTKPGPRQQAMQINVFTALLVSLKTLGEQKKTLEGEAVQKSAVNLIVSSLGASSPLLRCAAAEALGRLAQVVGDAGFVAGMAQYSFDKLKACRDVVNRTGHSLALGCLHRYVGSLGSGQHLNTSVSILLALAQDNSSPVVQVWALHALGLIADTGGPMFRGYVEPTLSLCLKLLLSTPPWSSDVAGCLGKLLSALITTVGPELGQNVGNIVPTRGSFLVGCAIMLEHSDPMVQAEAVACLQQLHLFAQRHVNLSSLVPQLCAMLKSEHLILRKSAISCLRQLVQREAKEVREHAQTLVPQGISLAQKTTSYSASDSNSKSLLPETGLEGALFALLDSETDLVMRTHIKEALLSLVQALAGDMLTHWLSLCKNILAATSSDLLSPQADEKIVMSTSAQAKAAEEDEDDDDERILGEAAAAKMASVFGKIQSRWPTRVFAVEVVRRLIGLCETERAHLDLALAKELQLSGGKNDYLVLHLSDLIRMAFMAATSDNTELRLAGLACLQDVISKFSSVPEPEFPGHVILEQFQAQVGAALRPAFTPETPSHVTAAACQVCSTWIGSGVARDLNDLRRVHQLLKDSLVKLKRGSISTQLYSESAATLEKLAILKAWAEVYIVAMKQHQDLDAAEVNNGKSEDEEGREEKSSVSESLLSLVRPELSALISHWLAALRDSALLGLPPEFNSQLPPEGGAYYTPETADACRQHYRQAWPPILLAATTWLRENGFELPEISKEQREAVANSPARMIEQQKPNPKMDTKESRFHLILGTCMEALCSPRQTDCLETIHLCLRTLLALLGCQWSKGQLMSNSKLGVEILNVMHRLILTRETLVTQALCMEVMVEVLDSAELSIEKNQNQEKQVDKLFAYRGGEGGEEGCLEAGVSIAYAAIEVCLCLLVRQIPQVNPTAMKSKSAFIPHSRKFSRLPTEAHKLISLSVTTLARTTKLCSSQGVLTVLPTVLFLIIGVLRETSKISTNPSVHEGTLGVISTPAAAALQALRSLIGQPVMTSARAANQPRRGSESEESSEMPTTPTERRHPQWTTIMQSALLTLQNLQPKSSKADYKIDETVIMLGTAVFLVTAPSSITCTPGLQSACIQLYRDALLSTNPVIRQKCLQTLQSIFSHKETALSFPFIHALAPLVLDSVRTYVLVDEVEEQGDSAQNGKQGKSSSGSGPDDLLSGSGGLDEMDLALIMEVEKCLETLVGVAEDEKRLPLVNLVVQLLMSFVRDDCSTMKKSRPERRLHEFCLQQLNKIGPLYPNHFKTVFVHFPELKSKLESAVQSGSYNSSATSPGFGPGGQKKLSNAGSTAANQQPSIKLTMDFSKFAVK